MDPIEELKYNELLMMKQLTATKARYLKQHWDSYTTVEQAELILANHPEWVNYCAQMDEYRDTYNNLVELEKLYINRSSTDED